MAPGSDPGILGWSKMEANQVSRCSLKVSREQSRFLSSRGMALKSLGPSCWKLLSFRVRIAALDPDRGGMVRVLPLLDPGSVATVIPQFGTSPETTFQQ